GPRAVRAGPARRAIPRGPACPGSVSNSIRGDPVNGDGPPVVPMTGSPSRWLAALRRGLGLPLISAIALVGLFGACFASAAAVSSTTDRPTAHRVVLPRCSTAGIEIFEAVSGSPTVVNTVYLN